MHDRQRHGRRADPRNPSLDQRADGGPLLGRVPPSRTQQAVARGPTFSASMASPNETTAAEAQAVVKTWYANQEMPAAGVSKRPA